MVGQALLPSVRSQTTAIETLRRALATGRVHHAYLFDGPDGVGKERAAVGLAQALVCERRAQGSSDACGVCSACVRAVPRPGERRAVHPDVVVLERGLYEAAAIGRRSPELQDISIDQVRTLVLSRAAFPPYEGKAKVFVVRRAEELSVSAANALLKILEEPGARTYFVLLSSSADSLVATIRSRTQRVRFGALPDDVVAELLVERGVDLAAAREIARLSGGSIAAALVRSDNAATTERESFVSLATAALTARDLGPALDLAEDAKKRAKDVLIECLDALAASFATAARATVAASDRRADVAAVRHALCVAAVQNLEANASTQLAMEAMLIRMRAV
jgi:DNA polymerase III subunit delta'